MVLVGWRKSQIKEKSRFRVTGLREGNSPMTGEFPAPKASNADMLPFDDVIMTHNCPSVSDVVLKGVIKPTCDKTSTELK